MDRRALWQVVSIYVVGGKLLRALQNLYEDKRMCVKMGRKERVVESKVGLRQGCVMSPWLFNIYMDGVVREVYARAEGKRMNLVRVDGQGSG